SKYPFPGSTSQTTLPIELRVKELKEGSGIDESTINLTLTDESGIEVPLVTNLVLENDDGVFNNYAVKVASRFFEDGDYTVKAYLEDWAGNPLDNNETPLAWTFSVDSRAPPRPIFRIVGGNPGPDIEPNTGQPMRWFTKANTPQFTLEFEEDDPVTVEDIAFASSPTQGDRADCVKNNVTNFFTCTFSEPVTVMPGFAWADYGILVDAFKTLADGTDSDTATYGPFDFTIDHEAPDFVMRFNHRIRDSYNLGINATVRNEGHPLKGFFEVLGTNYPLAMTNMMMEDYGVVGYSFIWPVPALSRTYEGDHDMVITLEDYAGNAATLDDAVYIDLTAPSIRNLTLDISKILVIGSQYYTRYANITISGDFNDDDVNMIWVEPGTYNVSTAQYEQRTFGSINFDAMGSSRTFSINVQLRGEEGAEILNNMTIFLTDIAGHLTSMSLNVWRDLKAPRAPRFCINPSGTGTCPVTP
ncbi:MAG: hypothetical protein KJ574_05315, partial [Nanoarchaeota archaeon]|nr:hypothetical protein [Nanoarchaeota archaeon]